MPRDILQVGDVWAAGTQSLELQNADTKRTASSIGCRNLVVRGQGTRQTPVDRSDRTGEQRVTSTRGYGNTMARSTLLNLLSTQYLRRGDGIVAMPDSRRNERLFGAEGTGRSSLCRACTKLSLVNASYNPRLDTCLKAYIRLIAVRADHPAPDPP